MDLVLRDAGKLRIVEHWQKHTALVGEALLAGQYAVRLSDRLDDRWRKTSGPA